MGKSAEYQRLLQIGRPPNFAKRFPHSKALIVSSKVIDRVLVVEGRAMTIVANGRNSFVIHSELQAAHRADAAR